MRPVILIAAFTVSFLWATIPQGFADSGSNLDQHSAGACRQLIANNTGAVTVECTGLSKEVGDQIIQILNKILSSQTGQPIKIKLLDDLSKSIFSIYDFNGVKRDHVGGEIRLSAGPETEVFKEMFKLESKQQWQDLINLCEAQISKTPDWLAPYFYAGQGYRILGDEPKAADRLGYVVSHAGSDPHSQQAAKWLAEMKGEH
jgi:hypothetical protein